jgi:2-polyprenyl-3-methyl-5-hydroxy-6-metoxy-1,4-benzoquinol methylase
MKDRIYKECKICGSQIKRINIQHNLIECVSCNLVFCEKKFTKEEFVDVYNKLYNSLSLKPQYAIHSVKEYNDLLKGKINIGYNRRRIINEIVNNKSKVLEIGSGVGLIGMYLTKKKDIKYQGIEIDKKTHLKAKELGVNSINGDFSVMSKLKVKYDTIMLWEVLEHLQDVNMFLDLVKERLLNNGNLVFSVPNYDKRKNFNKKNKDIDNLYQSGPPIHLNFFTKNSILNILNYHGFTVKYIRVKRFPYLNLKRPKFYREFFKSIFGFYEGPTLYISATYEK